jgi:hypothetical protein
MHSSAEPPWAATMRQQLEQQDGLLAQQAMSLHALSGALNALHEGRFTPADKSCVTADQLQHLLAASEGGPRGARAPEPPAPAAVEDTEASERAHDESLRLVDRAIAAGVWRDEDVVAFRSLLVPLGPAQRDEVRSVLVRALNDGRLRTSSRRPF